jgi:hypothetical protein
MKREEMVTKITNSIESMRYELLEAGVPKGGIDRFVKRFPREKTKSVYIQSIYKYLGVLEYAYAEVIITRKLLPQETWDRYKMMGFDQLTEAIMLKDGHRELRAAWNNAPKYIKEDHEKKITKKSKPGRKSSQKLQGVTVKGK